MRLYALLLVAGAALCARAASIPVAETEKKIFDVVPENLDKLPENTSSEQELIDQENTINDVDNKLRAKPEDIPVEVIVEQAQPGLKIDEEQDEEINRPVPDLRNPGPPQRQEHETQNPEFYASEAQNVALFKQSISDAQNVLSQGFQRITDGIQHIVATNEPIETLKLSIQSLRDSFTAQIVKVNGTIQNYLNTESASNDKPAVEQTKAGFHQIEQGLFQLRNEFNRGVSTLASGVDVVAALKADSEVNSETSGSTTDSSTAAPTPSPANPVVQFMQNIQAQFATNVQNMQTQLQNGLQNLQNSISGATTVTSAPNGGSTPDEVQSDTQVTSAPSNTNIFQNIQTQIGSWLNGGPGSNQGQVQNQQNQFGPVAQAISNYWSNLLNLNNNNNNNNKPVTPAPTSPSKPDEPAVKPEGQTEPVKSTTGAQADAVTSTGPIRQILQNNPITKGIAGAVQRLQNINNPEKPRDEQTAEQVKNVDEDKVDAESKKGGGPNTGDNNDSSNSSNSGVEQPQEDKEIEKVPEVQKVPEVLKASEDEIKEHKTEVVADKTE